MGEHFLFKRLGMYIREMISVEEQVDLTPYNSFGLQVIAKQFVVISSLDELLTLANDTTTWNQNKLILGGGSNLLLVRDFEGLVIRMQSKGIVVLEESEEEVLVDVQAGEVWNDFVHYCVQNNWGGVENLSLIPGSVGASPIQNIGAYGVELEQVFHSLSAFHIDSKTVHQFVRKDCEFGYRTSVFKTKFKGDYIILSVQFRLQKHPEINIQYGAINEYLDEMGVQNPTIKDVSNAVTKIRQSKLPDPAVLGNSGSFFKNPIIAKTQFDQLVQTYPSMPNYPEGPDYVKIPAGWLIEQCGYKGKQVGHTGTYEKQALIIVNHGGATGEEIWNFAQQIIESVRARFGIELEPEVNLVG